jgi:hypothetical protein
VFFKALIFAALLGGPQQLWVGQGGSPPLTAVSSPSSAIKSGAAPATVTTAVSTVTATGGSPPYTYAWTWSSGGASITITNPTGNATAFKATLFTGANFTGTALCTVTDSASHTATASVSVNIFSTD